MLNIHVGDIYFLTCLSRRGPSISLSYSRRGGETIKDYIVAHCRPHSQPKKYVKIEIKDVLSFPLRTILFIMARLAGRS